MPQVLNALPSIMFPAMPLMLRFLLFAFVAGTVVATWSWLGRPVPLPTSPLGQGEKLGCVSYTPLHGDQSPFAEGLTIPEGQIEEDMERLSRITSCVRTYAAAKEQGRIVAIAGANGLRVLQGIWLSRDRAENRLEVEAALAVAKQHPDVVQALIVGNETLLRGELSAGRLKRYIAEVKERSGLPVTYADVWEFWLRAPELVEAVDFVTIHILPYWEDHPVGAADAVAHVREVRQFVEERIPQKEIFIGEVGWPSAGRMRDQALPSPVNQALVLSGVVATAKAEGWGVNLIEAFDQPWKQQLEGTVGAHWGLFDNAHREPKFRLGEPVSNHPDWRTKAALGVGAVLLVFGAAWLGGRRRDSSWKRVLASAAIALTAGLTFGAAVMGLAGESVFFSGQLRAAGMLFLALAVPLAAAYAVARGGDLTGFADALSSAAWRQKEWTTPALALLLAATVVAGIQVSLGLVFDPRYKDFPVEALTGPVTALFVLSFFHRDGAWRPGRAETAAAIILAFAAMYIVINESVVNWQAVWLAVLLILLAATALRARAAPS